MIQRLLVGAIAVLLCACPPPFDVDVLNNSGAAIRIVTLSRTVVVAQGESFVGSWGEVFPSKPDPDSDRFLPPVLHLEHLNGDVEIAWRWIKNDDWVASIEWGKPKTARLQIDPDLMVRIVWPGHFRPVSPGYPQPKDWPLRPVADDDGAREPPTLPREPVSGRIERAPRASTQGDPCGTLEARDTIRP